MEEIEGRRKGAKEREIYLAGQERSRDWLSRLEKPAWLLDRPALRSVLHCASSELELSPNGFAERLVTFPRLYDRSIDPPRRTLDRHHRFRSPVDGEERFARVSGIVTSGSLSLVLFAIGIEGNEDGGNYARGRNGIVPFHLGRSRYSCGYRSRAQGIDYHEGRDLLRSR